MKCAQRKTSGWAPDCWSHLKHLPRKSFNLDTPNSTTGPHIQDTSVHKFVRKKIKLYPYKIQIVQSLEDPDYEKRE